VMVRWCHENTSSDGHALDRPRRIPEAGGRAPKHFRVGLTPPDYRCLPGSPEEMNEIISRAEAKAAGLKRYFTGVACTHGHVAERFVSSRHCADCLNDHKVAYRASNPDRVRELGVASYYRNHEKRLCGMREYHRKNADQRKKYMAARYYRDIELSRQEAREAYWVKVDEIREKRKHANLSPNQLSASLERARQYKKENRLQATAIERTRRARFRGSEGFHTATEITGLLQKQKCKCANCKVSLKAGYHADHIMPLARGGSNWISNIQLLCPACNMRKSAKDPMRWAQENGRLL
jgi:5-methylcytosine-specific restriction endonuclease McrA